MKWAAGKPLHYFLSALFSSTLPVSLYRGLPQLWILDSLHLIMNICSYILTTVFFVKVWAKLIEKALDVGFLSRDCLFPSNLSLLIIIILLQEQAGSVNNQCQTTL